MPKKHLGHKGINLKKYRGASYRYFPEDPDEEGRGPGYYRYQYGRFFKREWREEHRARKNALFPGQVKTGKKEE